MFRILVCILILTCGSWVLSVQKMLRLHSDTLHQLTNSRLGGDTSKYIVPSGQQWSRKKTNAIPKLNNERLLCPSSVQSSAKRITQSDQHKPVWVASYPGSGSELFRTLVHGLTGLETDEVYNKETSCAFTNEIAACKTHWPLRIGGSATRWGPLPRERTQHFAQQALVLLRNPALAIPAHFNYKWEEQHHITDHSQQGSEEDWKEWRDRRFEDSIQAWKHVVSTWEEQSSYKVAVYVPYESLTTSDRGPAILQSVANVLRESGSMTTVNDADIPCLWQRLVHDQPSKKRKHSYTPSFTAEQQQTMLAVIDELAAEMIHKPSLVSVLSQYRRHIQENLRID